MTRITIDTQTGNRLIAAGDKVELVDETGRVIGTFHPVPVPPYDSSLISPINPAERDRRAAESGGFTTEEVIEHLENV
jgi:hypothetical protein